MGLHFNSNTSNHLIAYSDLDWAGDPDNRRSITGICLFLGTNLISWTTKKQSTVSCSNAEAEYRALASATVDLNGFATS